MTILKKRYFNIFFQELTSVFFVLLACLIPLMEFINSNYNELDNIFNDNFLFLIITYSSVIVFIYFFSKLIFKINNKHFHISLMGISIWVFFQYNLLKSLLNKLFFETYMWHFSSEIALIIIIFLITVLIFTLKRNNNLRFFIYFFLILNFIYSSTILSPKLIAFKNDKNKNNLEETDTIKISLKTINKPNIYFFINDSMKPLNEFKDFYKIKLDNFIL